MKRQICTSATYTTRSPVRCAPPAPSEAGLSDVNDFSSPGISSRNKLRACRQKLEKSETDLKTAQKKERVYRHKYNKMKSIAKREKAAKKRALAQVSQLQGVLQGMQISANSSYMTGKPMFGGQLGRPVQSMQPLFFGNILQNTGAMTTIVEDVSIESVTVPDDDLV